MRVITVLVVDDSSVIRRIISESLNELSDIQVVATAADPFEARDKIKQYNPDVLTLDIDMPGMNGLEFLEKIMTLRPMPVIMISRLTHEGAAPTLRALELGAVDYIGKPFANKLRDVRADFIAELAEKIRVAARANPQRRASLDGEHQLPAPTYTAARANTSSTQIIAIGASTGGVETLCHIFSELPSDMPPIVITQHMPAMFTASFAARLDSLGPIRVCQAENDMPILPGHAYVAPGSRHLMVHRIDRKLHCLLTDGEKVSGHKPSVDLLFRSVAETVGKPAIGVILTGMGRDGAAGLLAMRQHEALTIGQNQSTSVIYGMPKEAMALGAVTLQLPLKKIANALISSGDSELKSQRC